MDSPVAIETNLSHLTPDSRELVSFIGRRNIKDRFRFTNTTRHTITKLCKMIHRSYMRIPHYSVQNILPNELDTFMSAFAKSETNHVPDSIFDSILSAEKIGRRILLKIQQREVVIHLILPKPASSSHYSRIFASTELADIFFQNCALRMIAWLQVAMPFAEQKCTETLRCYMFLTPHTKILPKFRKTKCDMGACSGLHEDARAKNERRSPSYSRNATAGACSGLCIRTKGLNNIVGEHDDEPSTHNTPITREHANTAFTWACVPHSEIVVFRMEEWFKVFIHETFHTLGLDFSEMDMTESNEQMSRVFGGCSPTIDFRIYESYSEVWAETINAIFVAYLRKDTGAKNERKCWCYPRNATTEACSGFNRVGESYSSVMGTQKRHKTRVIETMQPHVRRMRTMRASHTQSITSVHLGRMLRRVELYLQNERAFSMVQMAKVLHHHQLTYSDLCTTPDIARSRRRKYTEETQVFSYYIIKTILLFHLNDFIAWCKRTSTNREYGVSFTKTPENILEYVRLIERLHKTPEFMKRVGAETEYYSRNRTKLYPLLRTTMRMSLYESTTCS
jgi:hypothetical protein